jgi:hypothetical protein
MRKNGRNRGSEIENKRVCFASFSHNSERVIHMRKRKRNEAKKAKLKRKNKKMAGKESEMIPDSTRGYLARYRILEMAGYPAD